MRSVTFKVLFGNFIAVAIALFIDSQGGRDHFGERGFITFLSTFQLFAIAWLANSIARSNRRISKLVGRPVPTMVWRVIAWGFVFLAADEFLSLHEVIDLLIHDIFNIRETGLSDRLDDVIVALYGVFGIWLLTSHRSEFSPHTQAIAFFKRGFILLFVMVGLDLFSNERDLLEIAFSPEMAKAIQKQIYHMEDSIKMFAEAYFVLAFDSILRTVKAREKGTKYEQITAQRSIEPSKL